MQLISPYLAVIKLYSELGIWATRGRSVWADHGRSHSGLPMLPEGVLTEDKVGQVEWQACSLPDSYLQQKNKYRKDEITGCVDKCQKKRLKVKRQLICKKKKKN